MELKTLEQALNYVGVELAEVKEDLGLLLVNKKKAHTSTVRAKTSRRQITTKSRTILTSNPDERRGVLYE